MSPEKSEPQCLSDCLYVFWRPFEWTSTGDDRANHWRKLSVFKSYNFLWFSFSQRAAVGRHSALDRQRKKRSFLESICMFFFVQSYAHSINYRLSYFKPFPSSCRNWITEFNVICCCARHFRAILRVWQMINKRETEQFYIYRFRWPSSFISIFFLTKMFIHKVFHVPGEICVWKCVLQFLIKLFAFFEFCFWIFTIFHRENDFFLAGLVTRANVSCDSYFALRGNYVK